LNHPEARAILAEFNVTVIPASGHIQPGTTKSVANLQKIVRKRGFEHARLVVLLWRETNLRMVPMDSATLWAMSDTLTLVEKNFPHVMASDTETLFKLVDGLPIGWLQQWSRDVDGVIPRRFAMAGQIYERMVRIFDMPQGDLLDDRKARTA
jgi:hypothetical protein